MKRLTTWLAGISIPLAGLAVPLVGYADDAVEVTMHKVSSDGRSDAIGNVTLQDSDHGLVIELDLEQLPPGLHGFHVHENPDCSPAEKDGKMTAAAAAGGHYDPEKTGAHLGPYNPDGHLGDLPSLYVNKDGESAHKLLAPRLEVDDLTGRALMVHEGGDNYSDQPEPLGGGKSRIACGVIPEQ